MAEVKGVLATAMKAFLTKQFGAEAVDAAVKALPPAESALLQKRFLDGSRYPYETIVAWRHAARALVAAKPGVSAEPGAFLAEYVFTGVFKPLLAKDPVTMVEKIPWVKDFFYSDLEHIEAAMTGATSCRLTYRFEKEYRPSRVSCRALGDFWARTLELSGAKKVTVTHPACVCTGSDRCDFALSW